MHDGSSAADRAHVSEVVIEPIAGGRADDDQSAVPVHQSAKARHEREQRVRRDVLDEVTQEHHIERCVLGGEKASGSYAANPLARARST